MAGIQTSTGLISGVAIQDTVDQLIKIAARPRDRLTTLNTGLQNQQVAVGQLTALVIGVQLATDQLGKATLFNQTKVQVSSNALTATVAEGAKPGKFQFVPIQQAQNQQFTSSALASADQLVGAGEIEVHAGGFLDTSLTLDELNGGAGVSRGKIRITDRSGASATVDLRFAHTAADVVDAINSSADIRVTAKLDGDRFVLTDTSGGSGSLAVAEVSNGTTARDLGLANISTNSNSAQGTDIVSISRQTALRGLLDGRGLQLGPASDASLHVTLRDGTDFDFKTALSSNSASVGQLIDAINDAGDGKVRASINSAGNGLQLEDLTSGSGTFAVTSPSGTLARDLGWNVASSGGVLGGTQLQSGLGDVLLSSLNGGAGLGALGGLTITDRSGASATVNLSSAKTIGQVVNLINASGVGVNARLNESRTGITLVDTSGGSSQALTAASADATATASKLGFTSSTDPAKLAGKSLERQWINENTLLSDWDQGRGVKLGSIRFTNSAGKQSAISISQASPPKTIGDLLRTINKSANGVEVRINESGDGLLVVDTAGGSGELKVENVGTSSMGTQLKIVGTGSSLTVGGQTVKGIDGKLDFKVTTTNEDTVTDLVEKLNDASDSISASVLSLGNGGVRLAISSAGSGAQGRLSLDSSTLAIAFSETAKAQDALISVGGTSNGGGVLLSSTDNKFENAAPGVTVTINEANRNVVNVDVTENSDALSKQITTMVDQYNKLKDKLSEFTSYDASTSASGVLFGSTEALRIDLAFGQLFSARLASSGSIRSMSELGLSFTENGKLQFDKDRLKKALDRDPDAVKKFFTTEKTGFSAKAKVVADSLAGIKGGILIQRNTTLQTKIELNSSRIDSWNLRLDTQRNRLLTQFYGMEEAIAKIQSNQSIISKIQPITIASSK